MKKHKTVKNKIQKNFQSKNRLQQLFPIFFLIILCISFVIMCLENLHIQDDAFITFRYAKNFIGGHGLVFNHGEYVEGYTSILWTLLLSGFLLIGFNLETLSQALTIFFGLCSIWMTYFLTKNVLTTNSNFSEVNPQSQNYFYNEILYLLPSLMLTFTGAFQYWSISGMEVSLFVFTSLATINIFLRSFEKQKTYLVFGIIGTINGLIRPEGIILFLVISFTFIINSYKREPDPEIKTFSKTLLNTKYVYPFSFFVITNSILLAFRLIYYGYPLPNTFYAKTGLSLEYLSAGLEYFFNFLKTYLMFGLLLLIPIAALRKKLLEGKFFLLLLIIGIFILYSIAIGGDVLPLFRFLLPVLPLIYILFIGSLLSEDFIRLTQNLLSKNRYLRFVPLIIVFGITAYNYLIPYEEIKKFSFYENQLVKKMSSTSNWIQQKYLKAEKKLTVACTTIGAVSYYTDAKIVDMLGLTDRTIAHYPKPLNVISGSHTGWKEKNYNVDYIMSLQPDYIYFSTGIKPSAFAERALFMSESFVNNYYPYFFESVNNYIETIYKRKPLEDLNKNFIGFKANPGFDSNYVNFYNEILNIKTKPNSDDRVQFLCKKIDEIGPINFTGAMYQEALLYNRWKDYDKVFLLMSRAAAKDELLSAAHYYLAKQYYAKGNIEESKRHFKLVEKYNPEYLVYEQNKR
jgi:tetratricopeptide (TPR) repeat protein